MTNYVNQIQVGSKKIRSQALSPKMEKLLNAVGGELNVYFDVQSGGQTDKHDPSTKGKSGGWTGSHRHDSGNAGDVRAYTLNADGSRHYLDFTNPDDQKVWSNIVKLAVANGATGIGAGEGYMDVKTVHIGFGKPAVWGGVPKNGKPAPPAPSWLRQAYEDGQHLPPGNIPDVGTELDTNNGAPIPMPGRPPALGGAPNVTSAPSLNTPGGAAAESASPYTPTLGWKDGEPDPSGNVLRSQFSQAEAEAARAAAPTGLADDPRLMAMAAPQVAQPNATEKLQDIHDKNDPLLNLVQQRAANVQAGQPAWVTPMQRPAALQAQTASDAPTPMPGRPAALDKAPAAPQGPATKAPVMARLPSGKMIAEGTYPSSNDGSTVTITRGPDGNAVITRHDLGFMNPAHIGANTIVGQMAQQMIKDKAGEIGSDVQNYVADTAANVKPPEQVSSALQAIQSASADPGAALNNAGGTLANLFRMATGIPIGGTHTNTPQPNVVSAPSPQQQENPGTERYLRQPLPVQPQQQSIPPKSIDDINFNGYNGYRQIQEMGPQPVGSGNVTSAPGPQGTVRVNTVTVRPDGTSHPVQPAPVSDLTYGQDNVSQLGQTMATGENHGTVRAGPLVKAVTYEETNPAYAKWLAQYGNGGANVSGSPDDRDAAKAAVPPPPPQTIKKTKNVTVAPVPQSRPAALQPQLVQASGGRILQKNKDGSYTNIKTGTVSAGSSGKHYDLLEEAGAYN